jgi:exodeoxyribonuclease VII large subunit
MLKTRKIATMLSPSEIRTANQLKRGKVLSPDAAAPYSVSRLNREAKLLMEAGIPPLWLEAEISNLARPASGHLYFTLKDSKAQVRCAMFRAAAARAGVQPENGQQVLVHGRLGLYEPRGDYQLVVDKMEAAGEGMLRRAYEQLKIKLEAEGLFDPKHKKEIPQFPRRVGIITSSSGAAIRDIITVLQRRFPAIEVIVYPAVVQGDDAPSQIITALERANQRAECDVIICGRGGGSLEDLWAFNNEQLARAIFASEIPVISAVGHEVDYSIADFVADLRAATPSAAAELTSPDQIDWIGHFSSSERRLTSSIDGRLQSLSQRADWLEKRLSSRSPQQQLDILGQRLSHMSYKLNASLPRTISHITQRQQRLLNRLKAASPIQSISRFESCLAPLLPKLHAAASHHLETQQNRLSVNSAKLHAVSPLATLGRGYGIVQNQAGEVISKTSQVNIGERIQIKLSEGSLKAEVTCDNA